MEVVGGQKVVTEGQCSSGQQIYGNIHEDPNNNIEERNKNERNGLQLRLSSQDT